MAKESSPAPLLPSRSRDSSLSHKNSGLRSSLCERSYNTSAVGDVFPGTFENYVASIILAWQDASDERLGQLTSGSSLTFLLRDPQGQVRRLGAPAR